MQWKIDIMEVIMKRFVLMVVLVCMLALSMTGCFGKFVLTRKLYNWSAGIGGDNLGGRFVRQLVFMAVCYVPILAACEFADLLILNLIEFWIGSNPLAMNEGEMEIRYATAEGKDYEIVTTQNRYDISEVGNPENAIAFVFIPEESAWYMQSGDVSYKITEDDGDTVRYFNHEGKAIATVFN